MVCGSRANLLGPGPPGRPVPHLFTQQQVRRHARFVEEQGPGPDIPARLTPKRPAPKRPAGNSQPGNGRPPERSAPLVRDRLGRRSRSLRVEVTPTWFLRPEVGADLVDERDPGRDVQPG